jgi:hypothetical protein
MRDGGIKWSGVGRSSSGQNLISSLKRNTFETKTF